MYEFKMRLLYSNKEEHFWTKIGLLNFKITLPLAKSHMVSSKLASKKLYFSDSILVDIQLVTFLLLGNISELSNKAKTKIIL